jgi:allantoinase
MASVSRGVDLLVRGGRIVTDAGVTPGAVAVAGGRISALLPADSPTPAAHVVELAEDEVLLPGLVDTHVHVNEPGRTSWEGFSTATRAAAAGGVTTILDMPLNSLPPTLDVAALRVKQAAARESAHVDVGFWGGLTPDNTGRLRALHEAGVFGFKCFLSPSGVAEFPHLSPTELDDALGVLGPLGALTLVHAEDAEVLSAQAPPAGRRYADFLASRPGQAELVAIGHVIEAARRARARAHIVHLSCAQAIPSLAAARRAGVAISAETCPHYLSMVAEHIADGDTSAKACPPIRGAANQDALWRGLAAGVIESVVSDHSPCPAELKRLDTGEFGAAWGGIASLQLGLPLVWTEARRRGHALTDVARWMARQPAALAGLRHKGAIAPGFDADLVVFAPDEPFVVDARELLHRHPISPYQGRRLTGVVRATWLRGARVSGAHPTGRLLRRDDA